MESAEDLLREWFEWWRSDSHAPAKIPNALHVRTAMHLEERRLREGGSGLSTSDLELAEKVLGPDPGSVLG